MWWGTGKAHREMVSTTDIPKQPKPEVPCHAVEVCRCRQCGGKVRGQHYDVARGQHGATAHRVGSRVKALAHILHYVHGVPVRKTPAIVEDLTGVRLTRGALTEEAVKQAVGGAAGKRYQALRASVREQAVVHTDDTGWCVGGEGARRIRTVTGPLKLLPACCRPFAKQALRLWLLPSQLSSALNPLPVEFGSANQLRLEQHLRLENHYGRRIGRHHRSVGSAEGGDR
jgi:hypothetical protein